MAPLPLDSPRWASLHAHFGNASVDADLPSVPSLIARWNRAVGSYAEEYAYQDLLESYLHQRTILDVAYAVVPHVAARLPELDRDRRLSVLDDLSLVDKTRLTPSHEVEAIVRELERNLPPELCDIFIQNTRDRYPPLADDLAPEYLAAIEHAKSLAGADWGLARSEDPGPQHSRRHLRHLRASGWTEDDMTFGIGALTRELAEGALVYRDPDSALEGLRSLTDAPPGWFERTGLRGDDEMHRLAFLALRSLGWLAAGVDVAVMLRASDTSSLELMELSDDALRAGEAGRV